MNKTSCLIVLLLIVAAFLAGSTAAKIRYGEGQGVPGGQGGQEAKTTLQAPIPTQPPFNPTKSQKPEVKFFVMSFCPYGNQAEAGLEPVYQLLQDKVSWSPRYIVNDKKSACEQGCPFRVYNDQAKTRCEEAVKQGQAKDMETCKGYFPYQSADECLQKECAKLTAGVFESLHGEQEMNQDVREMVAYNLAVESSSTVLGAKSEEGILSQWWKFVMEVNSKCSSSNADNCWPAAAETAGLNIDRINALVRSQGKSLLGKEVAEAEKYQASGSPTVLINDILYNGGRSPEDYKKAICSAFENPPEECSKVLGAESAAASGGCGR